MEAIHAEVRRALQIQPVRYNGELLTHTSSLNHLVEKDFMSILLICGWSARTAADLIYEGPMKAQRAEIEQLRALNAEISAARDEALAEVAWLKTTNERATDELLDVRRDLFSAHQQLRQLTTDNDRLTLEVSNLERMSLARKGQIMCQQAVNAALTAENAKLKNEVAENVKNCELLRAEKAELADQLIHYNDAYDELNSDIESVNADLESANSMLEAVIGENIALEDKVKDAESALQIERITRRAQLVGIAMSLLSSNVV